MTITRDYGQIITKIGQTNWLMEQQALVMLMSILNERLKNDRISDEELEARLEQASLRSTRSRSASEETRYTNMGGVGVIPLYGPIFGKANLMTKLSGATSLESFSDDLKQMVEDDSISSILMDIDSPGGTSDLMYETSDLLNEVKKEKPLYAIANGMAGSAAYWLGSQADKFYVTPSGSVGSVGAYTIHTDRSKADENEGVKFTFISAGPYKTEGNPHESLSIEGQEYRQKVIDEAYGEFVNAVAKGRNTTAEKVKDDFGGGRMVMPKAALEAGMVDGIASYDALVGTLVNQPKRVVVPIHSKQGKQAASAIIEDNQLSVSFGDITLDGTQIAAMLESKEWEHSEPGTGSPPAPRTDEDGSDDPAVKGGWRRDPLPVPLDEMEQGGNAMSTELEVSLRELLEVPEGEDVLAAVRGVVSEHQEFRNALGAADEERAFAKQFPAMHKEHMSLLETNRSDRAKAFAADVGKLKKMDGENLKATNVGLSSLALETVAESHVKFAAGVGTVEDFENAIKSITDGGTVDYAENGSSREAEVGEIDLSSPQGIQKTRKLFADKVAEIKEKDELDDAAALKAAAKQYPDLAEAYVTALPVVR